MVLYTDVIYKHNNHADDCLHAYYVSLTVCLLRFPYYLRLPKFIVLMVTEWQGYMIISSPTNKHDQLICRQ